MCHVKSTSGVHQPLAASRQPLPGAGAPARRSVVAASALALALMIAAPGAQPTPVQDTGASGAWQKILKARTTASVMHTTAHPDDEHGGVITRLSRQDGARLALMTLNRGESGDNAIGPQLFDGLGLIRTEELRVAGRYYGLDEQYFTTVVDYGFSKRLEEAFEKWGRERVLRDVVRVIRVSRPWILLSRFQGNERDGHGNHQTAGMITQLAFQAAGDPNVFPEQIKEGLRPWQPFKVYMGGVRENEDWTVRIDSGEYSPVPRRLVRQPRPPRPQLPAVAERRPLHAGGRAELRLLLARRHPDERQAGEGVVDLRRAEPAYSGLFSTLGRPSPAGVTDQLARVDGAFGRAAADFTMTDPSAAAPGLAAALQFIREAIAKSAGEDEALFVLRIKERQTEEAITACLGLELTATAQPAGVAEPTGPFAAFAAPPTMAAPVPGQTFEVRARLANRGRREVAPAEITLERATDGRRRRPATRASRREHRRQAVLPRRFAVAVAADAPISTRPYFHRAGLQESRYTMDDQATFGRVATNAPLVAVARYVFEGSPVTVREVVRRREAKLPYGDVLREVRSVPRLGVSVSPSGGRDSAGQRHQARRAQRGRRPQRRGRHHRFGRADAAAGLDVDPGAAAVHVRAGRRKRHLSLHRAGAVDRCEAVPRRGRGDQQRADLSRGLRGHRPARSRACAISIDRPRSTSAASTSRCCRT